ncbi:MAG: flagellin [Lachnospiraceae bacterium]|jgi:flagellin|nr:flagellin [Lachnospiraceae bacterium]
MKINNNISAVITNKQLLRTEDTLAASMERLSSGLRINHAKDDPSGMAIAGKMNAQIDGLSRASRNSSDGISVLDTADGALTEVTSMLQRMRELSVQAANGTMSENDRAAIQKEIGNLVEEIDRISEATEFNTKTLLDGSLSNRVYGDHFTRPTPSSTVEAGFYNFTVNAAAEQASVQIDVTNGLTYPITADQAGSITINGAAAMIEAGMSKEDVIGSIRDAAEIGGALIEITGDIVTVKSEYYGVNEHVDVVSNSTLVLPTGAEHQVGKNAEITMDTANSLFKDHPTATIKHEGNHITFTDVEGFSLSMKLEENFEGAIKCEVTDIGPMDLQVGANMGQQITVRIPSISSEYLYLDEVDVSKVGGPERAMTRLDEALATVNDIRANLGAYTNRLEYTVSSLNATHENMNSAISRIADVDMATEMVEYTKDNVLQQAGTSALSQANELPQMALQLLQ